jgi:hypothetical protein
MDILSNHFLLGAIGGLAPEAVRLYSIARNRETFTWSWFYIIVSIVFACLAGLVAVILPAGNARAAFYAGISTPVLINAAVKKTAGGTKRNSVKKAIEERRKLSRFDSFVEGL